MLIGRGFDVNNDGDSDVFVFGQVKPIRLSTGLWVIIWLCAIAFVGFTVMFKWQEARHGRAERLRSAESISSEDAKFLVAFDGTSTLHLDAKTISKDIADVLARHAENLHLDRLSHVDASSAQALAKVNGTLSLNGLTVLSVDAAQALAQHKGRLILDGLPTLSDEAAKVFTQFKGQLLSLHGLTALSNEAVASLRVNRKIEMPHKFQQ